MNLNEHMQLTATSRRYFALALGLAGLAANLPAQTAPANSTTEKKQDTVMLTPFEVNTDQDRGYQAASSLSGGRADTPLKLTPASISVMTREFLDDLNINNLEEASSWAINIAPGNERRSETVFGSFEYNIRGTGGGGAFPTRNYFLFYANSDSYNTERFEFSRGPNALLFGDTQLGGMTSTMTKVARFGRSAGETRLSADSWGGMRGTFDYNYGKDRFAIRANAVAQRNKDWRDAGKTDVDGLHLAASYKISNNTQVRAEWEHMTRTALIYRETYSEQASYWNGTTFNNDNTVITGPNAFGLELNSATNPYLLYNFGVPQAGVLDYRNQYRTRGTGFAMDVDPRTDVPNVPRLPSREFNLQFRDSEQERVLNMRAIYLDHRFTPNFFMQLAHFRMDHDAQIFNSQNLAADYRIDVNRLLPNGQPNPKFGKAYADVDHSVQYQDDKAEDTRVFSTYKFDIPRAWDLKQRFTIIGGFRESRFEHRDRSMRWVNNPAQPNVNNDANRVRYRVYWEDPVGTIGDSGPPSFPTAGARFEYAQIGAFTHNVRELTYGQLVSSTTFWDDRFSIISGVRRDRLERNAFGQIGNDPVTGLTIQGGFDDNLKRNVAGVRGINKALVTSKNIGTVLYVLPWLGLQANYSESFTMPSQGQNKWDGGIFSPPKNSGVELGLRATLLENKLYATLTHYDTEQVDRQINMTSQTEIRRIWTNMGSTDPLQILVDFRDTEAIAAKGWEFELTANPTRNLRLTMNYARPENTIIDQRPGQKEYFAANLSAWEAAANNPALANRAQIAADISTVRNALEGIVRGALNNGTFNQSANFYATYSFLEGKIKGLSIGAGANFRDKRKVSSVDPRIKFNTTTATVAQSQEAAFDYIWTDSNLIAAAHASYDYRISQKLRARFQLNIANLFDNDDIQVTNYGVFNVGGVNTGSLVQAPSNYLYTPPRKITFSTTLSF